MVIIRQGEKGAGDRSYALAAAALLVAAALFALFSSQPSDLSDSVSSYLYTANDTTNPPSPLSSGQLRDFYSLAKKTGTDKVQGTTDLPACRDSGGTGKTCPYSKRDNLSCKVFGHFYDTIYQRWLGPMSTDDADSFQFLEIGFFNGKGFEAYTEFLPRAELHSMEISCLPEGDRSEGKWPAKWGNFAKVHPWYESLLARRRLHCGDASDFNFLHKTWTTEMRRPDAPPLKVVIDDGSHESPHMVATVFFWLPRLAPGGVLVVEDIEPHSVARAFRDEFLPQIQRDVHYCGGDGSGGDALRFPQLHPFLRGVHCEMHVCVFERNDQAAEDPDEGGSAVPPHALDASKFVLKRA